MRRIRKGSKRSVNNTRLSFILHDYKVLATPHCRKRLRAPESNHVKQRLLWLENVTLAGEIKSPLMCCNQVEPSSKPRQEEDDLQIDRIREEKKNELESMINPVLRKAE